MIKYNSQNINDWNLGDENITKVYRNGAVVYYKVTNESPTPTGSTCFEIISEPITSYTSTTYDSVYTYYDEKWYMLNNLNQYEKYGVYDIVEDIASATTYVGKLGVVGTTEYQYSGGSWSVVGSYVDSSATYTIDNTSPSPYVGQELSTTFKIPLADITGSSIQFTIYDENGGNLNIRVYKTSSSSSYRYTGNGFYTGTVTKDDEYAYLSLPSEAPQSIIINSISYPNSQPTHLIVGSTSISVEYAEKAVPTTSVYANVTELEVTTCPTVGIGQYGFVGTDLYKYFASEEWDGVTYFDPKMVAIYGEGNPMVVYKNGNTVLSQSETKIKDVSPVSVYVGDSVASIGEKAFNDSLYPFENLITAVTFSENSQLTSIDNEAFYSCSGLTSISIPSGVTSIGDTAFNNCSSLTSISIPSGVTSIGGTAFHNTPWWNTYSADTSHQYGNIVYINDVAYFRTSSAITYCNFREGTVAIAGNAFSSCRSLKSINIPNSVTSIGSYSFVYCSGLTSVTIGSGVTEIGEQAFSVCSGLTSVTVKATTPPSLGSNAFNNTNNCPIYVPTESVEIYKAASVWSTYASRIQAIT